MRKTPNSETGEPAKRYAVTTDRVTTDRVTTDRVTTDRVTTDRGGRIAGFGPPDGDTRTAAGRDTVTTDRGTRATEPWTPDPPPERRGDGPRSDGPRDDGPRDDGPPTVEPPGRGPRLAEPDLSAPWDDETGSFGTWLRRQREGRGIDLREIAEESKISLVNLRAFEEDRFEILPAAVFAKGFLRQYASYVGLDPEEVVNFYVSACRTAEGAVEPIEPLPETQGGSSWKLAAAALLLTALFALALWMLTRWNERPASPTTAPATSTAAPPTAAIPQEEGSGAEPETGLGVEGPPSAEPLAGDPPSGGDPDNLRVTLDFSAECWVEALVDGERQVAENKIQGESLLLEAAERVEITVGNFDAVQVEVNGHPFAFDVVPGTKVRTQRIDLETAARLAAEEDERGQG